MTDHAAHLPLVAFTSLAIAGAGLVTASAYFELVHGGLPAAGTMAAGAVLIAAGLLVSLGHLGRKRRAALAVRGAGRSALSNEALLAGFALAAAAAAAAMEWSGSRGARPHGHRRRRQRGVPRVDRPCVQREGTAHLAGVFGRDAPDRRSGLRGDRRCRRPRGSAAAPWARCCASPPTP